MPLESDPPEKTDWLSQFPSMEESKTGRTRVAINARLRQKASDTFPIQEKDMMYMLGHNWEAEIQNRLWQMRADGRITDADLY